MEKIKELIKNRKILTGAAAGLAVAVILITVIAVSCNKNDSAEKKPEKSDSSTTTAAVTEKNTTDEENTTEPETELSKDETTVDNEGSTEVPEADTTEQPETIAEAEQPTTVYAEPKTEAPTEAQPQTEAPVVAQPQPVDEKKTQSATEKATEEPTTVKHYADNGREMSELEWNILNDYWMEDVSYQYSAVYFIENEYGKGIQWDNKDTTNGLGYAAYESDGNYKIVEVFNGTSIIDFGDAVTIIYADGSFKELLKPSSTISSKFNEWFKALPSGSGICKYRFSYDGWEY